MTSSADIRVLPAELNIYTSLETDFSVDIDFSISLVGYTFSANAIKIGTESPLVPLTVTETSLATGEISLEITSADMIASLGRGQHRWNFIWTTDANKDREIFSGFFHIE